jgi:hypothetical protein
MLTTLFARTIDAQIIGIVTIRMVSLYSPGQKIHPKRQVKTALLASESGHGFLLAGTRLGSNPLLSSALNPHLILVYILVRTNFPFALIQ